MDRSVCSFVLLFVICSSVCGLDFFTYKVINNIRAPMFNLTVQLPVTGTAFIRSMEEAVRRNSDFRFTAKYYAMGGWYILGIHDVFEDKTLKTYWEFWNNGVSLSVGPSELFPKHNDTVIFNFTSDAH